MDRDQFTKIVEPLIKNGKLEESLELIMQFTEGVDKDIYNTAILQSAQYKQLRSNNLKGILSTKSYETSTASLGYRILSLLDALPKVGNEVKFDGGEDSNSNASTGGGLSAPSAPTPVANPNDKRIILLFSASPHDIPHLRVNDEWRRINNELDTSTNRDSFRLVYKPAVQVQDITRAMQRQRPEIVHFSGHGLQKNLMINNEAGSFEMFPEQSILRLFGLFVKQDLKCVVLNACYSETMAQTISELGLYVVGMSTKVKDIAAISFSTGFYQSLGEGNKIEFAFQIAMINLGVGSNKENHDTPKLWHNGVKIAE